MKNNWKYKGKVWMFGDDISTDLMRPGFMPNGLSLEEAAMYCMRANRPDWAEQVKPGDIIMGGRNFGVGSNRPAANSLKQLGLSVLVADSINSLMLRNCINFVMPALPCPNVTKAFKEGDIAEVDISTGIIKNVSTGQILETSPMSKLMLDIMEAGGVLSLLEKEGHIEKE